MNTQGFWSLCSMEIEASDEGMSIIHIPAVIRRNIDLYLKGEFLSSNRTQTGQNYLPLGLTG